jgi:hypothetical protein
LGSVFALLSPAIEMTRPNHAQALEDAAGNCRNRRRPQGRRRLAWVRQFQRARRVLDTCVGLINSSVRTTAALERSFDQRPIRSSRDLHDVSGRLVDASARLGRAARELAETTKCIAREPEGAALAPDLITYETRRWINVAARLQAVAGEVFALHEDILGGLESGTLVPEPETVRRPRIVLAPRPAPVRAFLRVRMPRATHRIAPILRRRRRIPRPAALRVPRRSVLGRAPPLSPVCPL